MGVVLLVLVLLVLVTGVKQSQLLVLRLSLEFDKNYGSGYREIQYLHMKPMADIQYLRMKTTPEIQYLPIKPTPEIHFKYSKQSLRCVFSHF